MLSYEILFQLSNLSDAWFNGDQSLRDEIQMEVTLPFLISEQSYSILYYFTTLYNYEVYHIIS